jgi:hypothetical protein
MPLSRKHFVATAALGLSAAALGSRQKADAAEAGGASLHFHIVRPTEFDHALMMKKLTVSKKSKQVFQSVSPLEVAPGIASLYIHMQNSLNAYEFSLGRGRGTLATLGVLIGPSIVLGLNDAMWEKYGFGGALKLARTNTYYAATSKNDPNISPDDPNGMFQDWSAQAVQRRGGTFMVCHNASTAVAALFASQSGMSTESVLADFERNLLPGFQMVPAGVAVVQLAQELGWQIYPII